jgi:oligoendopeptidase F
VPHQTGGGRSARTGAAVAFAAVTIQERTDQPRDAEEVTWDLEPLVEPVGGVEGALAAAAERAAELEAARGSVASVDAAGLRGLLDALAELHELLDRAMSYVSLRQSTDVTDPANGAALAATQERATEIGNRVIFFDLEWAALDDERVRALLADPVLEPYEHHLRAARRYRDHLLSEPEERLLADKSVTGSAAWARLFNELIATVEVHLDGSTSTLETALGRLGHPDRDVRRRSAESITTALAPGLRTRAFIFNTLLADKATDDRLRSFPSWISARNLANEATDTSVDALVSAVQVRYDIPRRWYRLKARLLGIDRLADYDRMAAVVDVEEHVTFAEARAIVLDAYASFSGDLADAAARFFEESWIDAGTRPGKRNGAYCAYTVPSHHPYVFLNWTYRRQDVLTLAHELGHGLHAWMARGQTVFSQSTGMTLAETASVFGETVTFGRLLDGTNDPTERLALLAGSIEGGIATVFRQTAMNRFEDAVHTARRTEGELSVDRFGELWAATQADMLGDSVEITDGYRTWWSYVPHFIAMPGYVYAYAYGQLLALSVYAQYEQQGSDFTSRYLHLLSAGGSLPPEELAMIVGCDLTDPGFWDGGLAIIDQRIDEAEALVEATR